MTMAAFWRISPSELDADRLTASLWWAEAEHGVYAYALQLFDQDGVKAGPQTDTVITESAIYSEDYRSVLPAEGSEYVLKLIVYDFQSHESQPGVVDRSKCAL